MTTKSEESVASLNIFPEDLQLAKDLLYEPCGLKLTNPMLNAESSDYGACTFELNGKKIQHRLSKITPTKTGQFVTIWKRNKEGITEPFDVSDDLDMIIITARSGEHFGQFIFPKAVLADKGIITRDGKEGKRGIRVYPPWDLPTSKQAEKTQAWQTPYFFNFKNGNAINLELLKKLCL
jgi:hypothetical protein